MIFSDIAERVISVELNTEASENGTSNARKNGVKNMEFVNGKVEDFLEQYVTPPQSPSSEGEASDSEQGEQADLLIIDPPRAGMHPDALPNILKF